MDQLELNTANFGRFMSLIFTLLELVLRDDQKSSIFQPQNHSGPSKGRLVGPELQILWCLYDVASEDLSSGPQLKHDKRSAFLNKEIHTLRKLIMSILHIQR